MEPSQVEELLDYYLPVLVTAGDFARAIQQRVHSPAQKSGPNAWAEAVTDADLSIQGFVEVATLARDPRLGFYGEESAQSAHGRYFDPAAETVVHLDPVNGTFLYKHQRDNWDIILGISHRGVLQAAVSYMPARGVFYLAVKHRGALTGDRFAPALHQMRELRTQSGSRVCLTYRSPEVQRRVGERYACFDIVADDDPARGVDNLNELFTGRLDAFACTAGDLLDWGAVAFIVQQAGGKVSTLRGEPLAGLAQFDPEAQSDMLVAASPAVHREILGLLNPG